MLLEDVREQFGANLFDSPYVAAQLERRHVAERIYADYGPSVRAGPDWTVCVVVLSSLDERARRVDIVISICLDEVSTILDVDVCFVD